MQAKLAWGVYLLFFLPVNLLLAQTNLAISFSQERGYFSSPFTLILTTNDPGATLVYTTNG